MLLGTQAFNKCLNNSAHFYMTSIYTGHLIWLAFVVDALESVWSTVEFSYPFSFDGEQNVSFCSDTAIRVNLSAVLLETCAVEQSS